MSYEVVVGPCEVVVAKETAVCRKWRGVSRTKHQVAIAIDDQTFLLSV
mgnify:CR=1 FL=1